MASSNNINGVTESLSNGIVRTAAVGNMVGGSRTANCPDSPQMQDRGGHRAPKIWERSQSAVELERQPRYTTRSTLECGGTDGGGAAAAASGGSGTVALQAAGGVAAGGGKVSEHSSVYWDLSSADDESTRHGGKFKISLQTIHQKEEITSSSSSSATSSSASTAAAAAAAVAAGSTSPTVSIQARVIRRMSSETAASSSSSSASAGAGGGKLECSEIMIPTASVELTTCGSPKQLIAGSPPRIDDDLLPSTPTTKSAIQASRRFTFTYNNNCSGTSTSSSSSTSVSKQTTLASALSTAVPALRDNIRLLRSNGGSATLADRCQALREMLSMIEAAWSMPAIGRDVAYGLCDVLRTDGGLDALLGLCDVDADAPRDLQLGSARVLAESMTVGNRDYVACGRGLEIVVRLASRSRDDPPMSLATTGIIESLFKHSQPTCAALIRRGGLDAVLYSCRTSDVHVLRRCAVALANLAIYGGADNQQEMIEHRAPEWLFPLAFSNDDSIRYYAFLAIAALSANASLESAVVRSGTLGLVEPFIRSHDPTQFGRSDHAHMHGQSSDWLRRLVPLLQSRRDEAQSLAAFHFAMEAGIRAEQGKLDIFREIGAIEPLKRLASGTVQLAARFAGQALQLIGEEVPQKLSPQVPLWTAQDVNRWLRQLPVKENVVERFESCEIDGDLLLMVREDHLRDDLAMENSVHRMRFMRDLDKLKQLADYESCDATRLDDWLRQIGPEFRKYTYQMIRSGVDMRVLRYLNDEHLLRDCGILNGIHRLRILEAARRITSICSPSFVDGDNQQFFDKPIDVFISYRRSTGSQLASLLKVHLQLRGLTVFLDIEKLRAGKFDDNLLSSVHNAKHFILVLTPNSLDRCVGDSERKDWVHREVVAALEGGCNIIPVMDSFQWPNPETLPEDMRPICYFNSIRWIHDYQDACVDKLENFITGGESVNSARIASSTATRPSMSKANSLTSPPPEMHGPVFPLLPAVAENLPPALASRDSTDGSSTTAVKSTNDAGKSQGVPSSNSRHNRGSSNGVSKSNKSHCDAL